jgi:Uma2 family endonuclease
MNAPFKHPPSKIGPDGLRRRLFTIDDIWKMCDSGIFEPDEKFELIEGEIFPMAPKKNLHQIVKSTWIRKILKWAPDSIWVGVEQSLFLSSKTFVDPDILVVPTGLKPESVRGSDVLLLIEVSDSSRKLDLEMKAQLYAKHGVRDYWVVDIQRKQTVVHGNPHTQGYGSVTRFDQGRDLTPQLLPGLTLCLPSWDD